MDPTTMNECFNSAISGASEGTASLAILGAWEGGKFLWRKIRDHPEKAQEIALERVIDLSERTSLRINALEQKIGGLETQVEAKLSDPDFIFLFHNACIAAARTEGQEYHELLARLISDRITAEPDSLGALAAHMACNAIPQLSPTHLRFLGAMHVIHHLPAPTYITELQPDARAEAGPKWFLHEIRPFVPIGDMAELDYAHLVTVSCITYVPPHFIVGLLGPSEWNLFAIIHRKFVSTNSSSHISSAAITMNEIGKNIADYWNKSYMKKASLTSAGALIGMYVRDALPEGVRNWNPLD